MRFHTYRTSIFLSLITLACAIPAHVYGKDAFGLDSYKHPVESITKTDDKYQTKYGNKIYVYTISGKAPSPSSAPIHPEDKARFLVQGGLHGNELLGSEFVGWLAQRFASGQSLLNTLHQGQVEIDFLPYANPDGTIQYNRYNGNKINLNRNFGVLWGITKENPGANAFSESETRAIRDLFEKRRYAGSIDVHGYINWVVVPTAPDSPLFKSVEIDKDQARKYRKWVDAIKRETMKQLSGYEIKAAGELGDGGAFEDYSWWGAKVPGACLELFSRERFVTTTLAGKIIDLLTPKALTSMRDQSQELDMFLVYEKYIYTLFNEALDLKEMDSTKSELSSISKQPIKELKIN